VRACTRIAWLIGALLAATAAQGAVPPPTTVDCAAQPCAEVLPGAASFRPVEGAAYWEGVDADGDVVGWLGLSTDFVDVKAYSGKPLVTLVSVDPEGVIRGARVVHHSEPILLVGIPESALHDFVAFYAGKSALQRVVVGRASDDDAVSVDAISGATVTVLAQNLTVLETARAIGTAAGVFDLATVARGRFVSEPEPWTWDEMVEKGALGHLVVTDEQMGSGTTGEVVVDLRFGVLDPPHIGRAILGERTYDHYMGKVEPGEHLFAVFNRGSGSFKGSAFVRGGIFDRIRVQQGLREITFRDTDYWNLPDAMAEGAPEFDEGGLFAMRGGRFDPGATYELVFLGSRYDHRSAYSREFREFVAAHQLPDSLYVSERSPTGIPWRQAWSNRRVHAIALSAYLLLVIGVFVARRTTTADPQRIKRLHLASLVVGFLGAGVWMGAQPSVTQILTAAGAAVGDWRWDLFLSEPLIFLSWIFIFAVSLIWGRGVFCGWVCPYGAMTELVFKLGQKLRIPSFELPDWIHLRLRYLRYVVLALLLGVFFYDSVLAERLAEVEPFKSTFLVPAWTRPAPFLAWWLLLLAVSVIYYRPFCRYLCPLGGGLALLSSPRRSGPKRRVFCSSCQICTRGCEPRALRPDGNNDPRECLSCMDCEATYRNASVCPPLIGITRIEQLPSPDERDRRKLAELRREAADV